MSKPEVAHYDGPGNPNWHKFVNTHPTGQFIRPPDADTSEGRKPTPRGERGRFTAARSDTPGKRPRGR